MRALVFLIGSLSLGLGPIAGCGSSDSPKSANGSDASSSDAGTGIDADSGSDADSSALADAGDSARACGNDTCVGSVRCQGVPYDQCGPVNGTCSCVITCLERGDGGTNCSGGSPCKTSPEGTKYCSATPAN